MTLKFHRNLVEFEYNAVKIYQCYTIIKSYFVFCFETEQYHICFLFEWSKRLHVLAFNASRSSL